MNPCWECKGEIFIFLGGAENNGSGRRQGRINWREVEEKVRRENGGWSSKRGGRERNRERKKTRGHRR